MSPAGSCDPCLDSRALFAVIDDVGCRTIAAANTFAAPATVGKLKGNIGVFAAELLPCCRRLRRLQSRFMIRECLRPDIAKAISEAAVMFCDVISDCHLLISIVISRCGAPAL